MEALSVPSLGVSGLVAAILQAENRQEVDGFEQVYLGK